MSWWSWFKFWSRFETVFFFLNQNVSYSISPSSVLRVKNWFVKSNWCSGYEVYSGIKQEYVSTVTKMVLCVVLKKDFLTRREGSSSLNFWVYKVLNKLNKQADLKGSYCFNLFIFGGPRHLSSLKQCSSETSLFGFGFQSTKKKMFLCLYYCLSNIVNIKILSLNFLSKTT